jgi:pimeloyl-[acyl-carrier protein] methyl ester esterase
VGIKHKKVTCLFVHGWAMNSSVWQPLLERLPQWIEAEVMDLPGHGQRTDETFLDLTSLTAAVKKHSHIVKKPDQPLILVAWSLAGLACLQLCIEQSAEVDRLMLVSSSPCFVARKDWSYGIDGEIFEAFSQSLKKDFSGTIRRFLALQVKGSESGREILRNLREKILQQPQPNEVSLDAGLNVLQQVDLRAQLEQIKQPISWLLGGQDGLVKAESAKELKHVRVFEKAGHAPFLSHTDEFVKELVRLL